VSTQQSPPPLLARLRAEFDSLGRELAETAALRWQLARVELADDLRRLRRTVILLVLAAVMLLAALPVLLVMAAHLLHGWLGVGRIGWLAIMGLSLLAAAALLGSWAWWRLRSRPLVWEETLEEADSTLQTPED